MNSAEFVDGFSEYVEENRPKKVSGNSKVYSPQLTEKYKKEKRRRNKLSKQARRKNRV